MFLQANKMESSVYSELLAIVCEVLMLIKNEELNCACIYTGRYSQLYFFKRIEQSSLKKTKTWSAGKSYNI